MYFNYFWQKILKERKKRNGLQRFATMIKYYDATLCNMELWSESCNLRAKMQGVAKKNSWYNLYLTKYPKLEQRQYKNDSG